MIPRVKTFLLAVVGLCLMAHVQTKQFTKDIVTSLNSHHAEEVVGGAAGVGYAAATALSASGHSLSNLDKTVDKRRPSSAVEDWSLVCQQLCG